MKTAALSDYLISQFETAQQNAVEISHDADIEYLHRFRVSIRRCRSLLKLFYADDYALNAILKEMVQKTNELRELDVFLASLDTSNYPTLTKKIQKFRKKRFKAVWNKIVIDNTNKKIQRLQNDICLLDLPSAKKELIRLTEAYYNESFYDFNHLKKGTSNEELHELRIRFKISRYALEFLNSCDIRNETKLIKECKQIQDHFGDIQDAVNQLEWLKHFCEEHPCNECKQLIKERNQQLKLLKKYM